MLALNTNIGLLTVAFFHKFLETDPRELNLQAVFSAFNSSAFKNICIYKMPFIIKLITAQDTTAANSITSCTKRQGEDYEGPFRPAKTMKEGSVLDLLKNPGKIMAALEIVKNHTNS